MTARTIVLAGKGRPWVSDLAKALSQRDMHLAVVSWDELASEANPQGLSARIDELVRQAEQSLEGLTGAMVVPSWRTPEDFADANLTAFGQALGNELTAYGLFLQAVCRRLLGSSSGGNLLSICDATAVRGLPSASLASAAQGALVSLMRSLSQEMAPHGITCNSVIRGWFNDMPERGADNPEENKLLRFVPAKRFGDVSELVGAVAYLLDEESRFVTGTTMAVDGGVLKHL